MKKFRIVPFINPFNDDKYCIQERKLFGWKPIRCIHYNACGSYEGAVISFEYKKEALDWFKKEYGKQYRLFDYIGK